METKTTWLNTLKKKISINSDCKDTINKHIVDLEEDYKDIKKQFRLDIVLIIVYLATALTVDVLMHEIRLFIYLCIAILATVRLIYKYNRNKKL